MKNFEKKIAEYKYKTEFCKHILNDRRCPLGNTCLFAHNKSELRNKKCVYGKNCKFVCIKNSIFYNKHNKLCKFIHQCETIDNYNVRMNSTFTKILKLFSKNIFGKYYKNIEYNIEKFNSYLSRTSHYEIPNGKIINKLFTIENFVEKTIEVINLKFQEKYYNIFSNIVTDLWAKELNLNHCRFLNINNEEHLKKINSDEKRFVQKKLSPSEYLDNIFKNIKGILSEYIVVYYFNKLMIKCPMCNVSCNFGICNNNKISSFRDMICLNCKNKGNITLFEIKTRNEDKIKNWGTYGGSYGSLKCLFDNNVNVFLVIIGRDTGNIYYGKINRYTIKSNKNWFYALQENKNFGGPSTYLFCDNGMTKIKDKMIIIDNLLSKNFLDQIINKTNTILSKVNFIKNLNY